MAGPNLPVNVDTTYADDGSDASVKLHQQHHDTAHGIVNAFDTGIGSAASPGQLLVWSGSRYVPGGVRASHPVPLVGEFVGWATANTNFNNLYGDAEVPMMMFWLPGQRDSPISYDAVCFRLSGPGGAGALVGAGVYADAAGQIGSLLASTANVDATVTGWKILTLSAPLVVPAGGMHVWAGIQQSGSASSRAAVNTYYGDYAMINVQTGSTPDDVSPAPLIYYSYGFTAGSWPMTLPNLARQNSYFAHKLFFRRSA